MSKKIELLKQIEQRLHIQPKAQADTVKPEEAKVIVSQASAVKIDKEASMPIQKDYLRIIIIAMAIILFLNVLVTIKLFSIAYSTNSVQSDAVKDLKQIKVSVNDFTQQSAMLSDDVLKIKKDTGNLIASVKNNDNAIAILSKKIQVQEDLIQKLVQNNNIFIKDMSGLKEKK